MKKFTVDENSHNTRLDHYLTKNIDELNRTTLSKLINDGMVLVNDRLAKPGHRLKASDKVALNFDFNKSREISDVNLPILYEDDDCIVINKPAGILTHSKGVFNPEPTVATFIADKVRGMDGDRAGIVHRLDRATSGVILCAKTPEALKWFQKQFSSRKVKKTYYAIISGVISPDRAVIDMPIERNPNKPKTFRTGHNGRPAKTEYQVVKTTEKYSLLKLTPTTGRTHQLRVHLAKLKHPIIGDSFYDGESADRLYLHAYELEITLPSKDRIKFLAELPEIFNSKML